MYSSETEIEEVVRGFEERTTGKTEFKHHDHMIVAIWYLQSLTPQAAVDRMRTGLRRFLDHHGVTREKYSEEITVFWISWIAEKLAELGPDTSLLDQCNYILSSPVHTPASRAANEESLAKS